MERILEKLAREANDYVDAFDGGYREAAESLGVHYNFLWRIIHRKVDRISIDKVAALCEKLDLRLGDLDVEAAPSYGTSMHDVTVSIMQLRGMSDSRRSILLNTVRAYVKACRDYDRFQSREGAS